ncbi:Minor capsid protein [Exiguobacterium sp. 8H]|uniref:putative minor capsid protein n=1 Tax=unclassified Exiguobacterium TaxID=2644629 RepID=UPI0012F01DB7|nr:MULTISPECIES: putative minor capsid protein [unclassified Exiguobacterium]VXB51740.1 Minor capsid protein [Exiguobacterium sp. 8A]VXB52401.1 Minor capsid protein [Exiguobacterium sp. 8H]
MASIQRRLLIHEITYEEYDENDRYGATYKAPVQVKWVRIEPKRTVMIDANNTEIVSTTLLFVDSLNTSPRFIPKEQSKITFEGIVYRIQKVNTYYANSIRVHHWEAVLV